MLAGLLPRYSMYQPTWNYASRLSMTLSRTAVKTVSHCAPPVAPCERDYTNLPRRVRCDMMYCIAAGAVLMCIFVSVQYVSWPSRLTGVGCSIQLYLKQLQAYTWHSACFLSGCRKERQRAICFLMLLHFSKFPAGDQYYLRIYWTCPVA